MKELEYQFNYRKLPELITHLTDELSEFESINDSEIAADRLRYIGIYNQNR